MPWEHRAAIFLKAADLLAGPYRAKINAATMLGQSKTVFRPKLIPPASCATFPVQHILRAGDILKAA